MLIHQTPEQFAARLNKSYAEAHGERIAQLSVAALNLIDADVITDTHMRSAFGLSVAEWAKTKGKMASLRAAAQLIKSARNK